MHNRWHVFVPLGLGLGAAAALAADASPDREISLTIYNKNIALIEHVRPISAPSGRQRIEFAGVSAQIVPETVSFVAPNVQLIEQNFDYDLLTPAKLMEKAVGSQVRLVRVNPATGAAIDGISTNRIARRPVNCLNNSGSATLYTGVPAIVRPSGLPLWA